jgi:uncharacterized protein (DUF2141 family)
MPWSPTPPVALIVSFALMLGPVAHADDSAPAAINVTVSTFRNTNGKLGCRLHSSADGFPAGPAGVVADRLVAIPGASAQCSFENVAPGTYAISVMHDENGNGKLDKSFIGIPTEGYGVSNNHTHAMSAPTWDESKFTVARGARLDMAISLKY